MDDGRLITGDQGGRNSKLHMKTFVITDPERGWDCVVGVYQCNSLGILIAYLKIYEHWGQDRIDAHVIHEQIIKVI